MGGTRDGVFGDAGIGEEAGDIVHVAGDLEIEEERIQGVSINEYVLLGAGEKQTIPARLSGTFTPTLQGLTTTDITLTGRIEMRLVSTVATLQGAP